MADVPYGFFGSLGDNSTEQQWQIGAAIETYPKARHTFADNKIQYNQLEVNEFSCTLHGAFGSLSDLSGFTFTLAERMEMLQQAIKLGFNPVSGWWVNLAVDLIRHYWNAMTPNDLVSSFSVQLGTADMDTVLGLGYSIVVSFNGNGTYNSDYFKDGVLDATSFGKATYGHCVRITLSTDPNNYLLVVDNYIGHTPYNTYEIPKKDMAALLANGVFSPNGYIFVFQNDLALTDLPPYQTSAVQSAIAKGVLLDVSDALMPRTVDSFIEASLFKLGVITVMGQPWTKGRWCVVLQRFKLL